MAVVGGYLLLNQVQVTTSFWSFGPYGGFGLTLLPLLVGVGFLFYNGRSFVGWLLAGLGAAIILASIIVSQNAATLAAGQIFLFLATVWLYGESLAVIEVGRESADIESEVLVKQLNSEAEAARDEAIAARIASAELVVAGKVARTTPVQIPDPATISEHSPMWSEAAISVTSVEKGTTAGSEVIVTYPESRDIAWYRSPQFHTGDEGIWILHRTRLEELNRDGLTALDPLDFHPMNSLERIRRIVRRAP